MAVNAAKSSAGRTGVGALFTLPVLYLVLFFVLPLCFIVATSFASRKGVNIAWTFNTQGWEDAFKPLHTKIFLCSLWYGVLTVFWCLVLGLPVCFFIARRGPRVRQLLYAMVLIPLVASSLSLVYAWKSLLYEEGLVGMFWAWLGALCSKFSPSLALPEIYNTGWASLVGMVYYYLPFMVYPIYTCLDRLDPRLSEASADLGATPAQSFWHVTLPLLGPGIGTGCVLVFIQTMGTFVIPDILAGNKEMLLGTLINQKFVGSAANWPLGAALSLLLLAVIGVALLIYFRLQEKLDH